jgi:5-formyltetrahydrofolate cyclo-ligase
VLPAPPSSELLQRARKQIRARMRALRSAYPESALRARSERIVERITEQPAYRDARSIALFYPLPGEVDLRALDASARSADKRVLYPVMDPNERGGFSTGLAESASLAELADHGRRFFEPPAAAARATRGEVDLIVVPALAVSSAGHRLGYGVGFYDATLPDFCPPAATLIVAFDFQLLAELPTLEHDFACELVVTDARTLSVPPSVPVP